MEKTSTPNERPQTLKQLKQADYNPRIITPQQTKMLKESLEEFGDLGGIVYNKKTGNIVGGNQRARVLPKDAIIQRDEEYPKPDKVGTVATGYIIIDGVRFSYREVEWDIAKEKAANIAANKHGGDFDLEKLEPMLQEIAEEKINLELTGFSLSEIYQTFGHDILATQPESLVELSNRLREISETVKSGLIDINEQRDNPNFYLIVIFKTYKDRKAFTDKYKLPDNRYIDARNIISLMKPLEECEGAICDDDAN